MNNQKLIHFVNPYYTDKDMMHDLSHIKRILQTSKRIMLRYKEADEELITYGCYFHGFIYNHEADIVKFLEENEVKPSKIQKIIKVAWESLKDQTPDTLEGKIVHDTHLIEGGKTFIIVKCLVTGTARGQSLEETINFIESNILDKGKCYLPEAIPIYQEMQSFAKQFIVDLKDGLELK
ncbi:hypothetical protein ERL59_02870 [Chengkuizengella sp. YPA3-1-1]|uniref:HD domain-containing protein n=1 Tax=Chengkuizengella marina TaxID=2507566 RepID=A0A6N9PZQ1_9BACL|nr:hypothetical protein [Chengkuizengella marina]